MRASSSVYYCTWHDRNLRFMHFLQRPLPWHAQSALGGGGLPGRVQHPNGRIWVI
jgi:hypothetical protein